MSKGAVLTWMAPFCIGVLCAVPQDPEQPSELRLRISVNLVQIDAIVTDLHGAPVPGLTLDDFKIQLDGKQQTIRLCNFVPNHVAASGVPGITETPPEGGKKARAGQPAMPVAAMKREDVRRTIVLFVDDLSMSSESVPAVRNGLRKFIETQIEPGDLVAIVRASAGLGALQDFTSDKRLLLAAAGQVRWNPSGRGARQAYTQGGIAVDIIAPDMALAGDIQRTTEYTVAVASSLRRLVRGMAPLPGRKAVVILSDDLPITTLDEIDPAGDTAIGSGAFVTAIVANMRKVVDESARAGVVLYAIDTRGIGSLRVNASDRVPGGDESSNPRESNSPNLEMEARVQTMTLNRHDEYNRGQAGAQFLATETGGFMVTEANSIDASIQRVMIDQSGYYVLGFTPPPEALEPGRDGKPEYHRLKVEVSRPGLRVRAHKGFFGIADEGRTPASISPELQLASSLESPFQSSSLRIDVQGSFLSVRKNDSFIQTAVILNGRDIKWEGPAINRSGVLHLLVRAYSVNGGQLEGGIDRILRVNLNEEGYDRAMKYGLIYSALLPVPKPGPYQIRAACREESTGKIGTGSDFVSIPKLSRRGLTLSGIVFSNAFGVEGHVVPAAGPTSFTPGERVKFAFQIINAEGARAMKSAGITVRARFFIDGSTIGESPAADVKFEEPRSGRLFVNAEIAIPANLPAGEALLRVDVENGLAAPGDRSAIQWARLRIVPEGQ
jgi:VWFA-related protein